MKIWEKEIPYFIEDADTPNEMVPFLLETDKPLPCVVVLPGGGYFGRARHEAEPIAKFFNSRGFHAVLVEYRVAPNRFPAALADVQRAVKTVRYHADEWKIDANRIVSCGFSAGGHLAASSILYAESFLGEREADEIDAMPHLPNGAILGYPVIFVDGEFGNRFTGSNLLGERYEEEKAKYSLAQYVTDQTPPVFMWHTSDDPVVNIKHSLVFGEALRDHGIPFEMHVFPHGPHGIALADQYPDAIHWRDLAADWIERNI